MHIRQRCALRHEDIVQDVFSQLPPAAQIFPALRSMIWTMAASESLNARDITSLMKRQIAALRDRVEGDPLLLAEITRKASQCAKF